MFAFRSFDREMARRVAFAPCIACPDPAEGETGTWRPGDDFWRDEVGVEPPDGGLVLVYPLCRACSRRRAEAPAFADHVDRLVIRRYRQPIRDSVRRPTTVCTRNP